MATHDAAGHGGLGEGGGHDGTPAKARCGAGACGASRRQFLGSLAALGASAILPADLALAAPTSGAKPRRIDVHHHFYPPEYGKAWADWATQHYDFLFPGQRDWTPAKALEEMDKNGVVTAVLSLASTPGVWFGGDPKVAVKMSRLCNDYAAGMMREHPGRFGLFASLPMLDVDASLREIEYALDVLKADGIGLATSYGDKWPGDPAFRPVFEELNRRKAFVYFHPLVPNCCGNLVPGAAGALTEVPQDTNRAVESLLFSSTFARLKDIRWMFSHAGGSIPMVAGRIATLTRYQKNLAEFAPDGVETELKKLYYETANSFYPPPMAALLKFVPASHVLFGTDFPYVSIGQTAEGLDKIGLSAAQLRAIEHENARRLLPRLEA